MRATFLLDGQDGHDQEREAGGRGSRLGAKEVPLIVRFAAWVPPIAWMGVVLWLSSDAGSAEQTGRLLAPVLTWLLPGATPLQRDAVHALARKAAHLTEYATLAALWFRALVGGNGWSARAAAWAALAISVALAGTDEAHQSFFVSRTASLGDVALDSTGALAAVLVSRRGWRAAADAATTVLLWTAVAGGVLVLVLNVSIGVPSGVLWLTVPAALLTLIVRRRWPRAP
jgi:VanZ family protein